jgi:hypothetical protein
MHFDITNDKIKGRVQTAIIRKQLILERPFRRKLKSLLDHQWVVVANHARHGVLDVEHVVDSLRGLMVKELQEQYVRIGSTFFLSVESSFADLRKEFTMSIEKKGMAEEFWQAFHRWAFRFSAEKVVQISDTTKRIIRRVIRREQDAGGSYQTIAEAIRDRASDINQMRSIRIARTEVHQASTYAVNEAVRSTRVQFEREWVSMLDDRTRPEPGTKPPYTQWDHRKANGQRTGMNEPFIVSGEALRFPGDPKGSAANVINCRCIVLYHAIKGTRVRWV